MSVPLTARQLEHEAELAAALPKQPAVIQFVVRWAAGKILEEREACADIIRKFLVFHSERAVSWHEVQDALDAIQARR